MGFEFLGQQLQDRVLAHRSQDSLRMRIWVALRYLTMVAAVIVAGVLLERSPGGGVLTGLGAGASVTGLLNVLFLPRDERSPTLDLILLAGGGAALALGVYVVTAS